MERFSTREKTIVAVALALAVAGGVFAWSNFSRAFPEAKLDFEVNRTSSRPVARGFLSLHAPTAASAVRGMRHAAIFQVDTQAKTYLEREVGLDRLGELVATRQVRLWTWAHRFFRPLDKEEVRVDVSPDGTVVGFEHTVPEAAPGATLEEAGARAVADRFLATAFSLEPGGLKFIESFREDRPHRRDWTFTYERAGWKAAEATWRIEVGVHGDEPASVRQYLKVPQAWTQSYKRLRSGNDTTALIAVFGIVLTLLAAVIVFLREIRRGNVRWRPVFLLTAVAFGLVFLLSLNDLPIAAYHFDTTGTWGAFLAGQLLGGLASAGGQALLIFLVVAAGEALYRSRFPSRLQITSLFRPAGWRTKRVAFGLVIGYCLAVLFIAYQVAFYLVGDRFGVWNPAEVPFDNLLNTAFPWLAVLFMGFYPAVSEEFMSRVFSIPLVERLARSRVAAVVIPAMIWGFAHANYPAQPFYIRGVEVSLAGLAVGVVLYRFGVIPCLVWHYVVDAGYTSMLLVRSGNAYLMVTALAGTGLLLLPLAVSLVTAWRRGGFEPAEPLLNAADPPSAAAAPEAPAPEPAAAVRRPAVLRASATLPAAVGLAVLGVAVAVMAPSPGRGVGVHLRPAAVQAAAERFLSERGEVPVSWRYVVTARGEVVDADTSRYLLEHGGVPEVASFARAIPQWEVRAFRPEDLEEWHLSVDDATGDVVRYDHILPEDAPGAGLPEEEARALAEQALAGAGVTVPGLVFRDARTEKRPARTDYQFTWKDPARSVGEAQYLLTVKVQGARVDGMTRSLDLPEAWLRARQRSTVVRYGLIAVKIALLSWLVVHGLFVFYSALRRGEVVWRPVLAASGAALVLLAVGGALMLPLAWARYPTALPVSLFRITIWISLAIVTVAEGLVVVLAFASATACHPDGRAVTDPGFRWVVGRHAVGGALAAVGVTALVAGLFAYGLEAFPTLFPQAVVGIPPAVASAVPGLAVLSSITMETVLLLTAAALAVHLFLSLRWPWLRWMVAAAAVLALLPSGSDAAVPELAAGLVRAVVVLAAAVIVVRWFLGSDPVAYVLAAGAIAVATSVAPLIAQPGAAYAVQGWVVAGVAAVAAGAWLARGRARRAAAGE